jgi:hypothetical protein
MSISVNINICGMRYFSMIFLAINRVARQPFASDVTLVDTIHLSHNQHVISVMQVNIRKVFKPNVPIVYLVNINHLMVLPNVTLVLLNHMHLIRDLSIVPTVQLVTNTFLSFTSIVVDCIILIKLNGDSMSIVETTGSSVCNTTTNGTCIAGFKFNSTTGHCDPCPVGTYSLGGNSSSW